MKQNKLEAAIFNNVTDVINSEYGKTQKKNSNKFKIKDINIIPMSNKIVINSGLHNELCRSFTSFQEIAKELKEFKRLFLLELNNQ